tara:strand:+ start:135 stop:782 length:648 start_codon:yes stop_codon:yes gene_type:complete
MKNLPYAQQVGTLEKMLEKIKTASVPEKFSQDFVSTKLSMKGGTARSTIPFIKKMGFVSDDGTPTKRYAAFRNPDKSGAAIADSIREVYADLFDMNEYVYELDSKGLKSLILEATGAEGNSTPVQKTLSTFMALNKIADFDDETIAGDSQQSKILDDNQQIPGTISIPGQGLPKSEHAREGINLSYSINLHLPPSTDIEVFNAIFKSLKQHLMQE